MSVPRLLLDHPKSQSINSPRPRPTTPTSNPRILPEIFHSYVPRLSPKDANILDEALAHRDPIYDVISHTFRLNLEDQDESPTDRFTTNRAVLAFDKFTTLKRRNTKTIFGLQDRKKFTFGATRVPYQNQGIETPAPLSDENFIHQIPKTPAIARGHNRVPLGQLPVYVLRPARGSRAGVGCYTFTTTESKPQAVPVQLPVTPQARPRYPRSRISKRLFPVHVPSQASSSTFPCQRSSLVNRHMTPSQLTRRSRNISRPFVTSLAFPDTLTAPTHSILSISRPDTSTRRASTSGHFCFKESGTNSRAVLDRSVRNMEGIAAQRRKLTDIFPRMAPPPPPPRKHHNMSTRKTDLELWLEKEMVVEWGTFIGT